MKASFELRRLASGVLGVTWALMLLLPSDATAYNHQWNKYHWTKTSPDQLVLKVGDCLGSHPVQGASWSSILNNVLFHSYSSWTDPDIDIDNWSGAGSTNLGLGLVGCDDKAANIKSYSDNYGDNGWLGLASIWIYVGKDKHIARGETKVNDYYIVDPSYDGFDQDIEWQHVLCQEIGHTFGVDHVVDPTCMNTETRPLRFPEPYTGDQVLLNSSSMYGHYHTGSGGGGGGGPGGGPPGGGPPGGGPPGGGPPAGGPAGLARAFWAERYDTAAAMFNAADAVVDATVISSRLDRYVGVVAAVPVTRVLLRVNAILKGVTGGTIVLEQTRGPDLEIVDDPGYVSNDNYILYLRQVGRNTFRAVNAEGRIRY